VKSYTDIPELENVVLEESWVLDLCATPGTMTIHADFALGQHHPAYRTPPPTRPTASSVARCGSSRCVH